MSSFVFMQRLKLLVRVSSAKNKMVFMTNDPT